MTNFLLAGAITAFVLLAPLYILWSGFVTVAKNEIDRQRGRK